jgi:hypothetical protein
MKNILYILLFIPLISNGQYTFDKRFNTDLSLSYGYGLIETDDHYICYGSKGDFGQQDTMRPMFLVVNKQGDLINNQNFDNNVCNFIIHNYTQNNLTEFIGIGGTFSTGDTCGFSVNGYPTRNRLYLHKLDKKGNLIWKKNYGDTIYDNNYLAAFDIAKTNDNNYFIYGEHNFKTFILKINEQGDTLWSKTFNDYAFVSREHIKKINDGYLCFIGTEVLKINEQADSVWRKSLGLKIEDIKRTIDNNFIISASSYSYPIHTTVLTKINPDANILWTKNYHDSTYQGFNTNNFRAGKCVTETTDGNFVTAYNDVIKVNKNGDVIWKHRYIKDNIYFYYSDVIETKDGGFLLTGRTGWTLQTILTKIDCNGNLEWSTESCLLPTEEEILVFPNPFQNEITFQLPNIPKENTLEINIYNMLGQKIINIKEENQQIININTSTLSKGIYLYQLILNGEEYQTGKAIKQ